MQKNISELYNQINFIVNGGALKNLNDFLVSKEIKALIIEQSESENIFNVLDSSGIVPDTLSIEFKPENNPHKFFSKNILNSQFDLEYKDFEYENWKSAVKIRGSEWEIFILMQEKLSNYDEFLNELQPYAGLIKIWQNFKKISITEKKLSRLSYMILATKSTLASIFEPMPLEYFVSLLNDVLQESLFPKSIMILKDEGSSLKILKGTGDAPERSGIFAAQILPPNPVVSSEKSVVLPVSEGNLRLFCLIQWEELPDEQTMNFLELLGNLAARAISINKLREQNINSTWNFYKKVLNTKTF